jgi:hypothetical protein
MYTVISGSLRAVFDSFHMRSITAVFHRIVNERKRSDTRFSGRLRQLLTVYGTTKNGRNTAPMKRVKYDKKRSFTTGSN